MKKTGKTIILNCDKIERRFALLNHSRLEEYLIERDDDTPKVGDIILARIVRLDTMLQAAFVDIGAEKNAFLHFEDMIPGIDPETKVEFENKKLGETTRKSKKRPESKIEQERKQRSDITIKDIPDVYKPGMEVLVQVVKTPISTKGARVTTELSIAGRYLVLMPYSNHIGISNRIENGAERERLRKILSQLEIPAGMGMICRTVGEGRKSTFFKHDLNLLLDYWHDIETEVERARAPKRIYTEPDLIGRTIRDFMTDEIAGGIIVDDKDAKKRMVDQLKRIGASKLAPKVMFYDKITPIFDFYRINNQLQEVFQREVGLPGGGAIVIDETEALIAIDVNSGKMKKGNDHPDFILQTNMEAADEIARQLKLRDIGGLVVIDFIDMKSQAHRDELHRYMKKLAADDSARTKILPLSKMGLMEMTRQREGASIKNQVFDRCPYCSGSGFVKSVVTISAEIQRKLNSVVRNSKFKNIPVRVYVHPAVLERLRSEDAGLLDEMERKYHHELSFRADPDLHLESFRLVDPETDTEL
ncbi:MAG: Rne/Rng family ribonuclease [Victivallaceae bacterium]|nr:Rne/Rng family ribonuclease [Victivallaceae bacterium]